MFNDRTDYRARKHLICNRVRAYAARNRRPIESVLEVKLAEYVKVTNQALKNRDANIYRPLLSYSVFQAN